MLVQDVMQTKLFTVTPETTLPEAIRLTGQRGVRHLPARGSGWWDRVGSGSETGHGLAGHEPRGARAGISSTTCASGRS